LSAIILAAACSRPDAGTASAPTASADLSARARNIAHDSIIFDGHIDVPYRIGDDWEDVSVATDGGDFDYPRARAGGLNAPFMSIYVPSRLQAEGGSFEVAEKLIDLVVDIAERSPEKFAIARSTNDVERHFAAGLISLPMGMENGSPLEGDLSRVAYFHERGIRYITLTHALSNEIADSSYDENRQWGGLSEFGRVVVREMNRVGIMVDISHVSDEAFWDVMEVAAVPAIASHSSARHFTPGWERNMNDEMINGLAENGGVIMINYGSSFLTREAREFSSARSDAYEAYLEEHGLDEHDDLQERFNEAYAAEHGAYPYATLEQTLDHFDHVVGLTSIDNVGIGTDYDGVGDSLPVGLKDVSSYPNLVEGLLRRGYSEADIRKILGGNLMRVWRAVEAYAAAQS
jgi:membrane dipeptidase